VDREGWERLHGGVPATALVRVWLRLVQGLARGPVLRVPPDALSLLGVVAAATAWVVAPVQPVGTAALAVLVGVLDGLDGAVALRTGRARPLGAVVDAVCDRVGDLLLVAALVALGAPLATGAALGAAVLVHEYLRARAQAAGMVGPGAVTLAERPTRIILVAVAGVGLAVAPAGTPWTGWSWAVVCVVVGLVASGAGLVQLALAVGRALSGQAGPTRSATIDADSITRGSPPPGCAEPPTR
jgi:CDP-diacylglycerol--glycerol-3-phosphate 3-phosphatidyltransferase